MHILDKIVAQKQREIASLPVKPATAGELQKILAGERGRRDFYEALERPISGGVALIAEVKKASPSAGVICADFDPVRIAREYEAAGAACLSVLTDEQFFQGSCDYLTRIREAVKLPLLRKDFIIDDRQIRQAAEIGADAILLIARILDDETLKHLHDLAIEGGLAVLVEVHDEREMDRVLTMGAQLIGVNNRDLDTFKVDLGTTERLAKQLRGEFLVAESGLHTRADVQRVEAAGAKAILVGESLMKNPAGIGEKVRELIIGKG